MRVVFYYLICFLFLFASNTDKKIKETYSTIKYQKVVASNMNERLDNLIKSINKQKMILNNINSEKMQLQRDIIVLNRKLSRANNNIKKLDNYLSNLQNKKSSYQKFIIDYFSTNYYLANSKVSSFDDLVNDEISKKVSKVTENRVILLSKKLMKLDLKIKKLEDKILDLKMSKKSLYEKNIELKKLEKEHKSELEKLKVEYKNYKKILDDMIKKQKELQNKLAKLNLIKQKEILAMRKAEELKRKREEERRKEANRLKKDVAKNVKVKHYGSSYIKVRKSNYRGPKGVAPLKNYMVVSKFGSYIDPVYHIRIYNDSVTLKGKKDEKVRAIFGGKVAFIGNLGTEKGVVIKHNNGLISIYSKLDKISPFLKKGYRIKQGEVVGRIKDELILEVTYKGRGINPEEVIK